MPAKVKPLLHRAKDVFFQGEDSVEVAPIEMAPSQIRICVSGILSVPCSLTEFGRFGQGLDGLIKVAERILTVSQAGIERPQQLWIP